MSETQPRSGFPTNELATFKSKRDFNVVSIHIFPRWLEIWNSGPFPEVTPEVKTLLKRLDGEMLRRDLQAAMELKDDEHFRKAYLIPALEGGLIEMTIPNKPRSSKQHYMLTAKGKTAI